MSKTSSTVAGKLSRPEFIALIAALMALNALAIDVMLPALPAMGEALNVINENDRQLVLSLYMFGFGITQLAFGPLSDRFGRRLPLLVGIAVYLTAAISAIFAPTFGTLLALRFVQGMGAAGTRVIAQSVIRDTFKGREMAEVFSLVFMVFMIMPVIAPSVGQILLLTGTWTEIFLFMGGLGAVIGLWALFRLPETLPEDQRRPLKPKIIIEGFVMVFTNRVAISYAMAGVFIFGALFGFINASQQIYVDIYGLGELFPVAFAAMAGIMAVSSYLNSRVVRRFGMRRISHMALLIFITGSIIWWAMSSYFGILPLPVFFCTLAVIMFMFGWTTGNMNSLAMDPLGKVAGTAAAVFGFIQTVGGALIGLTIGRLFDGTTTPIAGGYAAMGLCALVFVLIAEKGRLFGVGEDYAKQ